MAAVRLWGTLLTGMLSGKKTGDAQTLQTYTTELPIHQVSYYLMVWSSLTFGGIMLIEQYFGRRIFCFNPTNFTQNPQAVGEYCWEEGHFHHQRDNSDFYISDETWILHSFVYFFIRAGIFVVPHIIWQLKYDAWIISVIKGSVGLVKELQILWLQFSEVADNAYREQSGSSDNSQHRGDISPNDMNPWVRADNISRETPMELSPQKIKLHKMYRAVMAMTRDVVQITKKQLPHYTKILTFLGFRIAYETLALFLFGILDFIMFWISNRYSSTDFKCTLPNNETVQCMVPMMSFQWHMSLLSMLTTFIMLAASVLYLLYTLGRLCNTSIKGTFLDRIPYSEIAADMTFDSYRYKITYKLISKFMMQNIAILHPLNFLESFVDHIKENHQVGEELLPDENLIDGVQMTFMGAHDDESEKDGDDLLWRRLITT